MASWLGTGALALGQTLVWAGLFYSFPALLTRWETAFGWGRDSVALGMTIALLLSATAAPLAGGIIDAGRARPLLAGSAAAGAVALALLTLVTELWQFYLIWAVIGVAMAGCLYEPCFAAVTRADPAQARRRISSITIVAGFASTLAFPSAALLAEAYGWQAAVLAGAAVSAFLGAPLLWIGLGALGRGHPSPGIADRAPAAQARVIGQAVFWLLMAGFAAIALNHWMLIAHLLPLLAERGASSDAALLAISMIGPMQVAGRIVLMSLGERYFPALRATRIAFVGLALASLALMLLPAPGPLGIAALALFVILQGAGIGVTSILRPVLTAQIFGRTGFGSISGLVALPYVAGTAVAPFLGALIWSIAGYGAMLWVAAGLALGGSILIGLIRRDGR